MINGTDAFAFHADDSDAFIEGLSVGIYGLSDPCLGIGVIVAVSSVTFEEHDAFGAGDESISVGDGDHFSVDIEEDVLIFADDLIFD